jgi:hypothetical protein
MQGIIIWRDRSVWFNYEYIETRGTCEKISSNLKYVLLHLSFGTFIAPVNVQGVTTRVDLHFM